MRRARDWFSHISPNMTLNLLRIEPWPSLLFESAPTQKIPSFLMGFFCGERGIRTPEPVTVNGFQDRRIRPLCQLSATKVEIIPLFAKFILKNITLNSTLRSILLIASFLRKNTFFILQITCK
jgi:hypothetical protein